MIILKSPIKLVTSKNGEILIQLDLPVALRVPNVKQVMGGLVAALYSLARFVDLNWRQLWLVSLGIFGMVMGLVVSVVIAQEPPQAVASPVVFTAQRSQPLVSEFKLGSARYPVTAVAEFEKLWQETGFTHLSESGRPTERQAMVIGVANTHPARGAVTQLLAGERISIVGSNNAQYDYLVNDHYHSKLHDLEWQAAAPQNLLLVIQPVLPSQPVRVVEAVPVY